MARQMGLYSQQKLASVQGSNRSSRSVFYKAKPANLYLKDGKVFSGKWLGRQSNSCVGEVVFNTGMTGYVESLTDPSYAGQILVFTYPLIGNYGVQPADAESAKIQVAGVVVSEAVEHWNHYRGRSSLLEWLEQNDIPILAGADTRALTKYLRTGGTMAGVISQKAVAPASIKLPKAAAGITQPIIFNPKSAKKIIFVDCGAKGNILKSLLKLRLQVKQVPAGYDYTNEDYDGVLISNGPGDPKDYKKTIELARKALRRNKPVFGICLGAQLMALAAGAKTYKLRFGHRGHNQPCLQEDGGRCYITSQNHGYAIDEGSLPRDWRVTFRNLNDDSVEGIEHKTKPFFSVQFHPEACPGPTDTNWLFQKFYSTL